MTKFLKKVSAGLTLAVVGLVGWTGFASAAADADFASSTAALATVVTDNKGEIMTFAAIIIGISLLIALIFRLLGYGKRAIIGSVPGGRRRR